MKSVNTWISFLILLSVLISSIVFFKTPFEGYLHYAVFILLFPPFIARYGIPKLPLQILLVPLFFGVIQILMGNNTPFQFTKIFIGVLLSTTFYFYVIQYYSLNIEYIFRLYLKGILIASVIGSIQAISFRIGFTAGYNYRWIFNKWGSVPGGIAGIRINSVFSEPAQFAIMLSPATLVAIHHLFMRNYVFLTRNQCVLVLVIMLLTSSSTGYIGFFIIALLLTLNYGKLLNLLFGIIASLLIGTFLYKQVPEFKSRVDTSMGLWQDQNFSLENVNTSSFVLYNNFHIALENFKDNPIAGSGLGSHAVAFDKYTLTKKQGILDFSFNKADANSMFLRIVSEMGLMGIIFIFGFIGKNFVRRNKNTPEDYHWLISNALLVLIILNLIRQGNYFLNGFPLFMWMYYYNRLSYKRKKLEYASAPEKLPAMTIADEAR